MLVRSLSSMEDDESWEVDDFEATSDDEGGILIVPVSDNSGSDGSNRQTQTAVPTLYLPNATTASTNGSDVDETKEATEDETLSTPDVDPRGLEIQEENGLINYTFGPVSGPRRLLFLIISLVLLSSALILKSFRDQARYRELQKAAWEAEMQHLEQIRLLQEYKKSDQESCWYHPTLCGRSLLSKGWESLPSSAAFLGFGTTVRNGKNGGNAVETFSSTVDKALSRFGKWKETTMRKALSNKDRITKKIASIADLATSRIEKLQDEVTSTSFSSVLSLQGLSNSTSLKTVLNNSMLKSAAVGTAAALLVGALFEFEFVAGEVQ